jgi:hypothetical protein
LASQGESVSLDSTAENATLPAQSIEVNLRVAHWGASDDGRHTRRQLALRLRPMGGLPVTGHFEQYVLNDVVAFVDAHHRTIPHARSRGVFGFSTTVVSPSSAIGFRGRSAGRASE